MDRRGAAILVAEIGADRSRLPRAAHLASWAGMVPGQDESAGKRRSGKTRKGDPWLRAFLVQAAHATGRTKATYRGAHYRRRAARRGRKKAAVAVGHSIRVIACHLLRRTVDYQDLGPHSFDERDRERVKRRLVRRLEDLGYQVTAELAPVAASAGQRGANRASRPPRQAGRTAFSQELPPPHAATIPDENGGHVW